MEIYNKFINKLINEAPDFMKAKENDEEFIVLDYLVTSLSEKAMPWLFKVYLDKQFNIIVDDKLTNYIKEKYKGIKLNILDVNGNLFVNNGVISVILKELELANQGEYNKKEVTFSLK